MWTYPVLVFAIVILSGYFNIKTWLKYLVSLLLIISTSCFLVINNVRNDCFRFNNTSIFLLDNFPALYSPFYGTFYNRNDELILSYLVEEPSYYFSSNKNYLTKILFKSTDEYKKQILSTLYGDDDDISYLKEKINKIPSDNKYHYINISPLKNIKLDKYNIEQLGFVSENEVIFRTDEKIEIPASKKIETKKILTFNSKPYTLYKIDIEFDESTLPLKKDCLEFSINDIDNYYYNQIFARKNQYSLFLHTENNDISELIIESSNPESFVINNITITSMTNEVTVLNQNSPIEISGDMKEDEVVFKLDAQSFEYYKVMIELENPQDISNDDKFYLATRRNSFYYVHEPEFEIFEKSNTFIINSHDMTLTESSLEIVIVGETQKPIIINSIKIERTG